MAFSFAIDFVQLRPQLAPDVHPPLFVDISDSFIMRVILFQTLPKGLAWNWSSIYTDYLLVNTKNPREVPWIVA